MRDKDWGILGALYLVMIVVPALFIGAMDSGMPRIVAFIAVCAAYWLAMSWLYPAGDRALTFGFAVVLLIVTMAVIRELPRSGGWTGDCVMSWDANGHSTCD